MAKNRRELRVSSMCPHCKHHAEIEINAGLGTVCPTCQEGLVGARFSHHLESCEDQLVLLMQCRSCGATHHESLFAEVLR